MNYITRALEPTLKRYLKTFPVIGLTGPRQSGKSTLLLHQLPDYKYITFDDHRNIELFTEDPVAFINQFNNKVIFDEIQYVPELFHSIKIAVDKDRDNYGKFVITGSNQFSYLQQISESLAGRIGLLSLLPLQFSEIPKSQQDNSILHGCYPEIVRRNYTESDLWYSAYIDTYLNKDVRVISNIIDLREFQSFIKLLCANVGQQLVLSNYAKKLGVSVPTVKRWLSILEASYIIFTIPPFYQNFGKRITKSPKLYFYDTGLVCHMLSINTQQEFDKSIIAGQLFENYVVSEINKKNKHEKTDMNLYFLRTSDGKEIDLILERKNKKTLIEIKKNSSYKSNMVTHLKTFMQKEDRGLLIYTGKKLDHPKPISVVNFKDYLNK